MRIALVNKFLFEQGGQEAVLLEEARLLANAGHTVALWGMSHPKNLPDLPYQETFAPYVDFSNPASGGGLTQKLTLAAHFIRNPRAARGFTTFLDDFQPDIIHCHGIAHQLTPTILQVAKGHGIPVIQTLHDYQLICPSYTLLRGDGSICHTVDCQTQGKGFLPCVTHTCIKNNRKASILNALEMQLNADPFARLVDQFIGPSQFLVDLMKRHGIRHIQHVTNCVVPPADTFDKPDGLPGRYVLYAGRLSHEKGLDTLLAASLQVPDLPLVIVGGGAEEQLLKQVAGASSHIHWLGFLPRQQVMALMQYADAMILPSEWYENGPMSIIEAQLMRTPVVAASIGGLPEAVLDGENGWLFPSADVNALIACLQDIEANPAKAQQFGDASRSYALKRYSPDTHLQQLLAIYNQYCA